MINTIRRHFIKYNDKFCSFGSYSTVMFHDEPVPRGSFKRLSDVKRRITRWKSTGFGMFDTNKTFGPEFLPYDQDKIRVVEVEYIWQEVQ